MKKNENTVLTNTVNPIRIEITVKGSIFEVVETVETKRGTRYYYFNGEGKKTFTTKPESINKVYGVTAAAVDETAAADVQTAAVDETAAADVQTAAVDETAAADVDFKPVIDELTKALEEGETRVITSPKNQRENALSALNAALSVVALNERFKKFCTLANRIGWCFTVNKAALCGVTKNGEKQSIGFGMTDAEYTAMNAHLITFRACLADFISADRAHERIHSADTKKLRKLKQSICFEELKALKKCFHINAPCTAADITFLAYRSVNLTYADRDNIKVGYTVKQCGAMTLLNMVLKYTSASMRIESAVNSFNELSKTRAALVNSTILDTLTAATKSIDTAAADTAAADTAAK